MKAECEARAVWKPHSLCKDKSPPHLGGGPSPRPSCSQKLPAHAFPPVDGPTPFLSATTICLRYCRPKTPPWHQVKEPWTLTWESPIKLRGRKGTLPIYVHIYPLPFPTGHTESQITASHAPRDRPKRARVRHTLLATRRHNLPERSEAHC